MAPGDVRDTTTPNATLGNMHKILPRGTRCPAPRAGDIGNGSRTARRGHTACARGCWAGDKTGTWDGENNEANDIAILGRPNRKPTLVTAYYASSEKGAARDAVLAEVGGIVATKFA